MKAGIEREAESAVLTSITSDTSEGILCTHRVSCQTFWSFSTKQIESLAAASTTHWSRAPDLTEGAAEHSFLFLSNFFTGKQEHNLHPRRESDGGMKRQMSRLSACVMNPLMVMRMTGRTTSVCAPVRQSASGTVGQFSPRCQSSLLMPSE